MYRFQHSLGIIHSRPRWNLLISAWMQIWYTSMRCYKRSICLNYGLKYLKLKSLSATPVHTTVTILMIPYKWHWRTMIFKH